MDQLTLTLSSKHMDIVANALGQRPYIEVAELLQLISTQIRAQQAPPAQLTGTLPNGNDGHALPS